MTASKRSPDIVSRMADKIRELGANGGVTAADLDGDFTRAEIEKHSAEAADLAKQLSRAA